MSSHDSQERNWIRCWQIIPWFSIQIICNKGWDERQKFAAGRFPKKNSWTLTGFGWKQALPYFLPLSVRRMVDADVPFEFNVSLATFFGNTSNQTCKQVSPTFFHRCLLLTFFPHTMVSIGIWSTVGHLLASNIL